MLDQSRPKKKSRQKRHLKNRVIGTFDVERQGQPTVDWIWQGDLEKVKDRFRRFLLSKLMGRDLPTSRFPALLTELDTPDTVTEEIRHLEQSCSGDNGSVKNTRDLQRSIYESLLEKNVEPISKVWLEITERRLQMTASFSTEFLRRMVGVMSALDHHIKGSARG